ncbi:MAG: DUF975 family protein [Acetivibrionales bacterium]
MYVDSTKLTPNQALRAAAREQLKGKWGKAVLVALLYMVIVGVIGGIIPIVGGLIVLFITGPLLLGVVGFFLRIKRGEEATVENLFDGFKCFVPSMVLYLLTYLFILLWSLLLIIPGIIASLRYSQAFFIMKDNPEIKAMDAIKQSKEMMEGNKSKLFLLWLSFIGWAILAAIPFGIGFLWLIPYIKTTMANFYEDLKNAIQQPGTSAVDDTAASTTTTV